MSTPCACFTRYIMARTSSGTGYIRKAFNPRSNMCVLMPTLLKGAQKARTASLGFSPANKLTCSKAPPLVSTRAKHPISMMTGAIRSNWSLRGWNLPDDCHMSRYMRLNCIFLFIFFSLSTFTRCCKITQKKSIRLLPHSFFKIYSISSFQNKRAEVLITMKAHRLAKGLIGIEWFVQLRCFTNLFYSITHFLFRRYFFQGLL